jgi:hypothetical protein
MINIKGYDIPTNLSDMTIKQFESLNQIMNNTELLELERYLDYLELFIQSDDLYTISDDELFSVIELIGKKEDMNTDLIKTIELDGYTYTSYTDEFTIKAIELSLIEKRISKNPSKYFSYILSIIFKRNDLSNREHYTEAHLKHKENIFGELSADLYYPYVIWIASKLNKKLNTMYDKPTE